MTTTQHSERDAEAASFILNTGQADCHAYFFPGLYRLQLVRDGQAETVDLGFSGSRVLERLLREPGKLVSRETLIERGWPNRVVGQGSLNQQIHSLRQLLRDDQQRGIIQTVPRQGYMFNRAYYAGLSLPQPAAKAPAMHAKAPSSFPPPAIKAQRPRRWSPTALVGLAGMLMSLFILGYGTSNFSRVKLVSTEVNGGKAYILYVNHDKKVEQPKKLVLLHNMENLATVKYLD